MNPRFVRLAETARARVRLVIDGQPVEALAGDTLMVALLNNVRHLRESEGEPFGLPLVLRGAEERLAPILMTALATGLALLPLVINGNRPGHEIEYPLAVVILGGLCSSTLLNLFVLPPLYARFGRDAHS